MMTRMSACWVEEKPPQHARDRRRDGVGKRNQELVGRGGLYRAIGEHREHERDAHGKRRRSHRENDRDPKGREIGGVRQDAGEIRKADELFGEAEGVLLEQRASDRLEPRPYEEDERDRELRREQQERHEDARKYDALVLHAGRPPIKNRGGRERPPAAMPTC
jgi:hypothetical protein